MQNAIASAKTLRKNVFKVWRSRFQVRFFFCRAIIVSKSDQRQNYRAISARKSWQETRFLCDTKYENAWKMLGIFKKDLSQGSQEVGKPLRLQWNLVDCFGFQSLMAIFDFWIFLPCVMSDRNIFMAYSIAAAASSISKNNSQLRAWH